MQIIYTWWQYLRFWCLWDVLRNVPQCLCQTSAASASKVWGVLRLTPCHYIHNTGDLFNLKRDPLWSMSSRETYHAMVPCKRKGYLSSANRLNQESLYPQHRWPGQPQAWPKWPTVVIQGGLWLAHAMQYDAPELLVRAKDALNQ